MVTSFSFSQRTVLISLRMLRKKALSIKYPLEHGITQHVILLQTSSVFKCFSPSIKRNSIWGTDVSPSSILQASAGCKYGKLLGINPRSPQGPGKWCLVDWRERMSDTEEDFKKWPLRLPSWSQDAAQRALFSTIQKNVFAWVNLKKWGACEWVQIHIFVNWGPTPEGQPMYLLQWSMCSFWISVQLGQSCSCVAFCCRLGLWLIGSSAVVNNSSLKNSDKWHEIHVVLESEHLMQLCASLLLLVTPNVVLNFCSPNWACWKRAWVILLSLTTPQADKTFL